MALMGDLGAQAMPQGDWFAQFGGGQPYEQGGITGGPQVQAMAQPQAQPGTQGQAGMDAFGRAWTGSGGRTVEDLKNFVAQHPEYGVTLGGSKGDKVYGPDGQFWADAVLGAGAGGQGATWQTETGGGGVSGGGNGYTFGPDDPSYAWRLGQGVDAVQKSAAARGTLLSGGTLKDLTDYGQGLASTEFGNAFGRKYQLAGLGLNAANSAAALGSSYGQNLANLYTGQGNANAASTIQQGNANAGTLGALGNIGADLAQSWKDRAAKGTSNILNYGPGY